MTRPTVQLSLIIKEETTMNQNLNEAKSLRRKADQAIKQGCRELLKTPVGNMKTAIKLYYDAHLKPLYNALVRGKAAIEKALSRLSKLDAGMTWDEARQDLITGMLYCVGFAGTFVASVFLTNWTLAPAGMETTKYLVFAIGASLLGIFITDYFLTNLDEHHQGKNIMPLYISGVLLALYFVSLAYLGIARGAIYKTETLLRNHTNNGPVTEFYKTYSNVVQLAIPLLAVLSEVVSGLLFHLTKKHLIPAWKALQHYRLLETLEAEINKIILTLDSIKKFPKNVESVRMNHNAETDRRRELKVLLIIMTAIVVLFVGAAIVRGEDFDLEIGLDMTRSSLVAVGGIYEFQWDTLAILNIINSLTPSTSITIFGLTDNTFTIPRIILQDYTSSKTGYFGEILENERDRIKKEWKRIEPSLGPEYDASDILGFFYLLEQKHKPGTRTIAVLFSDMRNCTTELDLESMRVIPKSAIEKVYMPKLKGIDVYVYGVHSLVNRKGLTKSHKYWLSLKDFWSEFFKRSGAVLKAFSPMRDIEIDLKEKE